MPELARVTRLRPPSPAAQRVEVGYLLLEAAMVASLLALALALLWTPIPDRAIPPSSTDQRPSRAQTL